MSLEPHSNPTAAPHRWAVIGGGISGLVAAWQLRQLRPDDDVVVYEGSERLGGILGTHRLGDWLVEQAADMFVTDPADAVELCQELGIADQLLATNADKRGALIAFRKRMYRIPEGFSLMAPSAWWPIASTGLLTWRGKLRLLRERFVKPRAGDTDEDFESFAIRRCGQEAYERLIQPLVSGIYTADPRQLSMRATSLKRFVDMESRWGSMTRGVIREALQRRGKQPPTGDAKGRESQVTGARYGMFVAPRDGMQTLIDRLAESLGDAIRLGRRVTRLCRESRDGATRWRVTTDSGTESFDGVIVATQAAGSAALLRETDALLADDLDSIEHASCAVVVLGMKPRETPPPVFGVLVPNVERRPLIAAALTSHKFPGRAPDGGLLVRVFFGGALNPEIMRRSDEELIALAQSELQEVAGIAGPVELTKVVRWADTMPQYHVGHLAKVARIEERANAIDRLVLIGNAFHGVGIPDCVRFGRNAARRLVAGEPAT